MLYETNVSALSKNIGLAMVLYRHLFFLVYKIDFTIVQLLSIVYFIGQESITETTEYFKQTCYCIRHNIMLLWFVKIYERNLEKLQFTTQRFDTPV